MKGRTRGVHLLALALLAGCDSSEFAPPPPTPPALEARLADVRARTALEFPRAALYRPLPESTPGFDVYLSPMLIVEAREGADESTGRPCALRRGARGRLEVDASRPVVYFEADEATLRGASRRRLAFLWCAPAPGGGVAVQGLRMTFASDGFPALYEVLADPGAARLVFVSSELEKAAAERWGGPLEGRRFAVEGDPPAGDPEAVVAGLVEPGPAAMGPFLYLAIDAASRRGVVTTALCRCTPVQFGEVSSDVTFELVPLAALVEEGVDEPTWSAGIAHEPVPMPPVDDAWLERALRLPEGF